MLKWSFDNRLNAVPFWLKTWAPLFFSNPPLGEKRREVKEESRVRDWWKDTMDRGGRAPSRPPSKAQRVALQRTGGMMAAGAWAARLEVADLLEGGADPNDVVDAIRSGKEEGKSEL